MEKEFIDELGLKQGIKAKGGNLPVLPAAYCVNGNDVWIVHSKYNAFFRYNLQNKETVVYSMNPYGEMIGQSQYCGIHFYDNKVFLVPCWGKELLIYNVNTTDISVVEEEYHKNGRFIKSYVFGRYLYCVPFYEDYFLKIDMKTEKIVDRIYWRKGAYGKNDYINGSFVHNGVIYCVVPNRRDSILVVENNKTKVVETEELNESYTAGCVFRNKFYLYGKSNEIVYEYDEFQNKAGRKVKLATGSCFLMALSEKMLLHESGEKDELFCMDEWGNIHSVDVSNKNDGGYRSSYLAGITASDGGRNFYYDRRENVLYEIYDDYSYIKYEILFDVRKLRELNYDRVLKEPIVMESEVVELRQFIRQIIENN